MIKPAYYNEFDPYAAQWLRNLIAKGHIAPGDVDERSIEDVKPGDLNGYVQCHFFAGIGVWSYALRRAGWEDSRSVWSASCPCQPFSAAGAGEGFADERHLWPALYHLVDERRPSAIVGEQVASKDADPWIDLVQDDLEVLDYAFGAVPFPAASIGAPHIRDRLYWIAFANPYPNRARRVGNADYPRLERFGSGPEAESRWIATLRSVATAGQPGGLADDERIGLREQQRDAGTMGGSPSQGERAKSKLGRPSQKTVDSGENGRPGPTNGIWRNADWLHCRDGKWRPVESGTFPLAHGAAARVGRLRAYGNAINAEQAKIFIEIAMQCAP